MSEDVLMWFCVAGVALCDIRRVCVEECVCATVVGVKLACQWGKPKKTCLKRVFLNVSEDVLMSFSVAGVALCDIRRLCAEECVCARPS